MTAVNYLWDPVEQNIVRELDDSGNVIAQYTTEPGLYGDLLSQRRNGEDSYYHYDGQGSTVALTNSAGDVTDTYEYSAFGEVTEHTGGTVNPFQYVGQKQYYRGEETKEYEVRRRPLSQPHFRWLTFDPLYPYNLAASYTYTGNNPVNSIDPSGLLSIRPICEDATVKRKSHGLTCGETARSYYVYELDADAPCPGYIVQRITAYCKISLCKDCPIASPTSPSVIYYEAWEVDPKVDKRHEVGQAKYKHTDASILSIRNGHCGSVFVAGMAKYFCKDPKHPAAKGIGTGDLAKLWRNDREYNPSYLCDFNVRGLLSVKEGEPNAPKKGGWFEQGGVESLDTRSSSISWSCCPCSDPDRPPHSHAKPNPLESGCISLSGPVP